MMHCYRFTRLFLLRFKWILRLSGLGPVELEAFGLSFCSELFSLSFLMENRHFKVITYVGELRYFYLDIQKCIISQFKLSHEFSSLDHKN